MKPRLDNGRFGWELHAGSEPEVRVNIGAANRVLIDKLYGPLAAYPVRVSLDANTAEWVVEYLNSADEKWEVKARWSCQENIPEADE